MFSCHQEEPDTSLLQAFKEAYTMENNVIVRVEEKVLNNYSE